MIVSSGRDERVEMVNAKFTAVFGYTIEDMPDVVHWWPLAYPDEAYREAVRSQWSEKTEQAIQNKSEIEPMEATVRCRDGSYRHVEFRLSSVGDRHLVTFLDLTEQKRTEEALRYSEARIRSIIDAVAEGIVFQASDGTIIEANKSAERILGLTQEQALGRTSIDPRWHSIREDGSLFPGQDHPAMVTLRTGEPQSQVVMGINKPDGTQTWISINSHPLFRPNETLPYAVVASFHDITERKQAEEALKKNNALLERIFSSTEFLIAYLDPNFNFIRVNRAYAEADQQTPEYFVGKNHFSLYPNEKNEKIFRNVLATGEAHTVYAGPFVYPTHPERGTTYWNWTLHPVKEADGSITGLVLSMVDVTARERAIIAQHESDSRYRTLVEQASDGIFVADPQGNYIDVNPSGCAMLGYTREEILALNMETLTSPESLQERPLQIDEMRAGRSVTVERELITKSKTALPVEISGKMLDNGNFLGIVRDITERKRHERERKAIITVSAALRQVTSRTETLTAILKQLEELFETDGVVLVLPNPQNNGLIDEMGRGVVGERMKGLEIPPGMGVCNWVIENKKPYLTNHAENDPLFYRPDLLGDARCLASVPLIMQEQAIGALWIARRKELQEYDLHLLNAIADIAASAIHRAILNEQIEQQVQHLLALHQIDIAITANFNLDITLEIILKHVKEQLAVDAANILLINPLTYKLEYRSGLGFKTRDIERSSINLGEDFAGRAVLDYQTASCPDLRLADAKFSRSSLLAKEKFISYFAAPLIVKGQVKGVLEIFNRKPLQSDADWLDYFEALATQTAIAIENAYLLENLQKTNQDLLFAYDATIEGWSRALDLRDKETEGHSQRVTEMALELASKLGMSEIEKTNLRRGALLHDIGKMGVPDAILHKPGPLSESEWEFMRKHPTLAYQMLSPISYLKRALEIPYYHHEKWDGTGYPHGVGGEEIPLAARIFSVVDVFDALTSNRPYRKAWSDENAYRYIEEQAGKHFDPQIVKVFLENRGRKG